tara:strand:- start:179 stop:718 length:540 start_codon:yes stop_codon:yes gene_type:complete
MINRNSPCPCGSKKKHKKCCLIITNEIKSEAVTRTGEKGLTAMLETLANNSIKNMSDAKCNQNKVFGLGDFQLLLDMSCALWNISFLPAKRSKELASYIEKEHYRSEVNRMVIGMRKRNSTCKLMIASAIGKELQAENYPVEFEVYKTDLEFIEENIEESVNQIIEAVDFMIHYSSENK